MCSNPRNTMCSHSLLDKKPSPSLAKSLNSWHNSTQKSTAAPFLRHLLSLSFSAPTRRRLVSAEMCRVSQFFKEFGTNLTLNPAPPLLTSYRKMIQEKIGQNLIFPTIYLNYLFELYFGLTLPNFPTIHACKTSRYGFQHNKHYKPLVPLFNKW